MSPRLNVTHTSTFDGKPLATVDGLPGGAADLTPAQLRALSSALAKVADECDNLPIRRGRRCIVRQYPLTAGQGGAS